MPNYYLTDEQEQRLNNIASQYVRQMETADEAEKAKLAYKLSVEFTSFIEQCTRENLAPLKDDHAAILDDAQKRIQGYLETNYRDMTSFTTEEDLQTLQQRGVASVSDGKIYLNAEFAADLIRGQLKIHLEMLKDDTPMLQQLLSYIVEAVENSEYTDSADINILPDAKVQLEVMRYRRSPLGDIAYHGLMNDKTNARILQDADIFDTKPDGQMMLMWSVNQAPKGKEEQVPVLIALTYEGTEGNITKKLTAFDKAVYDAVGTRFFYWKQETPQRPLYITPQEIWRTMNGKKSGDGKSKPSKAQVKRICDSLDKMRFTHFHMDISEEIKAHYITLDDERVVNGRIDSYLLNSSKVEFITDKGNTVTGYRIGEEPILYTYNAVKDRLLYVPYEMLDISQNTSDVENVTEFKNYLLQQIQLIKNAAESKNKKYFKRSNIILLETIYKETGILTPEERAAAASFTSDKARQTYIRKTRKADREKIEGMLDTWKAKGWIKDYTVINNKNEPIKEKQQAKGYKIVV